MWTSRADDLKEPRGQRLSLELDGIPATFGDVLSGWQDDEKFSTFFNSLLADAPFDAFRWETPALSDTALWKPFEFVLLDSPGLARQANSEAFAEHFCQSRNGVVVFPNLGRDATLIVPSPEAEPPAYGHLAAFVRLAPERQRHALWQMVGAATIERVGSKPVWLNTAGAGVPWLHVRIDRTPKYYRFLPYRHRR